MDDAARSKFASDGPVKVTGETGRDDTMQCVDRDEGGVTTEPSIDSSGTMIVSICEEVRDKFSDDDLDW